jgi:S-adenosylmethionine-dependent methyltransferase
VSYDPDAVVAAYEKNAAAEDAAEKGGSLRTEIPRAFIRKYLKPSDVVLDAGGGTGINAIMMAERCQKVTLLDITPGILALARENVAQSTVSDRIEIVQGDITDLRGFEDGQFSFVVCVGDAISYVLDGRFQAMTELVRVAREGSILVIGCDSQLGFLRWRLAQGDLEEALAIWETAETTCGMGPRTHLYTVSEMRELIEGAGCQILEVASTPTVSDTFGRELYAESGRREALKRLELELCTRPELLGMGLHLLFVARRCLSKAFRRQ